jgi:hypothetical protein
VSYGLWVFKGPIPVSEEDFTARLARFNEGDETAFDASPDVAAFYEALMRKHPPLEDLPEDKVDRSVWSMTPDPSDRLVSIDCAWPAAERMAKDVGQLARKHGLALMDPQSGQIVRP